MTNPIYAKAKAAAAASAAKYPDHPGMNYAWISPADTAKLVRPALAKAFPGVKFGVTTKVYSGGASITVRIPFGGPSSKDVDAVVGPFAGGRFDGMIDMAYSVDSWLNPDGSATYGINPGSAGSRGVDPGYSIPKSDPDAVRVKFGANYIFASRTTGPGGATDGPGIS
jgi:hypothetical protein